MQKDAFYECLKIRTNQANWHFFYLIFTNNCSPEEIVPSSSPAHNHNVLFMLCLHIYFLALAKDDH